MKAGRNITIRFKNEFINKWKRSESLSQRIRNLKFVKKCTDVSIVLEEDIEIYKINQLFDFLSQNGFSSIMFNVSGLDKDQKEMSEKTFFARLSDKYYYNKIDLGPDVAEHEENLSQYFFLTNSYYRVLEGEKKLVVGPKGSGKSAIKQIIYENYPKSCILVTPEHYSTEILNEILENPIEIGAKERAFSTAWKHTLIIEILKKIMEEKKGIVSGPYVEIHKFIRDNFEIINLDLFSRFVRYIKQIEGIKIGKYEVGFKTSELSRLYSMEELYNVLPSLKKVLKSPFYILIDELDQGWDNSEHSNNFIIGLFLAANELNSYHEMLRCCSFIRGEIFDMVIRNYSHTDKLRYLTEELSWNKNSLISVLVKRIAYSLDMFTYPDTGKVFNRLFDTREIFRTFREKPIEYIFNRTSMRPRELIQFIRVSHNASVERNLEVINSESIEVAESIFSKWKFEHICSEYLHIYPGLRSVLSDFRFKNKILSFAELELLCIKHIVNAYESGNFEWLVKCEPEHLIQILYKIEFIGIPNPSSEMFYGYTYSFENPNIYIRNYKNFQIHPSYWKHLSSA